MENKISGLTKEQVNQYINEGKVNKVKRILIELTEK